jgi:thiamine biosynthesis lipoprotein
MAEPKVRRRAARFLLGTMVDIAAAGPAAAVGRGIEEAFAAIARVHRALSAQDAASELTHVNGLAHHGSQPISEAFRAVLVCALDMAERTRGAFDPTIGGLMCDRGFLPTHSTHDRRASWRDVCLDASGVSFARPLLLDFGGIAKGYAVDRAIDALRDAGAVAARVNAGGDIRVFGGEIDTVHVRTGGARCVALPLVELADGAVATSAYGSQRRRIAGRWATPLIDTRFGLPSMTTRTVSVVAPHCMLADALTKVVALRGAASAAILAGYGAEAIVLTPVKGRWRCVEIPADRISEPRSPRSAAARGGARRDAARPPG